MAQVGIVYPLVRNETGTTSTYYQIDNKRTFTYKSYSGAYFNGTVVAVVRYTKTTD